VRRRTGTDAGDVPITVLATIEIVNVTLWATPGMTHVAAVVVHDSGFGPPVAVTTYEVIGRPPVAAPTSAVHLTTSDVVFCDTERPVTWFGRVAGIAEMAVDAGPVPDPFVAVTVARYVAPLVRPLTTQLSALV
jgi:hypothetical protein